MASLLLSVLPRRGGRATDAESPPPGGGALSVPSPDPGLKFRDVSVAGPWGSCLGVWEVPPGPCPPLPLYLALSTLCCRNAEKILGYLHTNVLSRDLIPPHVNFSHLTAKDYTEMYKVIRAVKEDRFASLGLDPCLLEDELDKVWDRLPFPARVGRKANAGAWNQRRALGGWGLHVGLRRPPGPHSRA